MKGSFVGSASVQEGTPAHSEGLSTLLPPRALSIALLSVGSSPTPTSVLPKVLPEASSSFGALLVPFLRAAAVLRDLLGHEPACSTQLDQ